MDERVHKQLSSKTECHRLDKCNERDRVALNRYVDMLTRLTAHGSTCGSMRVTSACQTDYCVLWQKRHQEP
eukprot:20680-Eustigmatos_ZCMA.PRE.1